MNVGRGVDWSSEKGSSYTFSERGVSDDGPSGLCTADCGVSSRSGGVLPSARLGITAVSSSSLLEGLAGLLPSRALGDCLGRAGLPRGELGTCLEAVLDGVGRLDSLAVAV